MKDVTTSENFQRRVKEMAMQIARCPGRAAQRARAPTFVRERLPAFFAHWRGIFDRQGHGAPIDRIDRSKGLQKQILNMNDQHQRWYKRKFGVPDVDVLTAQDLV